MLLGPHSRLRPVGGESLDCRGQRLCGSGLLSSGGLLQLLHQARGLPPQCTVQGYMRSVDAGGPRSQTHTLRAPAAGLGSVFLIHLHMTGAGGIGLVGDEAWAADQSSIASSWSAKSSNMLPMSSKMETVVFLPE